jgi:hypothetical protein
VAAKLAYDVRHAEEVSALCGSDFFPRGRFLTGDESESESGFGVFLLGFFGETELAFEGGQLDCGVASFGDERARFLEPAPVDVSDRLHGVAPQLSGGHIRPFAFSVYAVEMVLKGFNLRVKLISQVHSRLLNRAGLAYRVVLRRRAVFRRLYSLRVALNR